MVDDLFNNAISDAFKAYTTYTLIPSIKNDTEKKRKYAYMVGRLFCQSCLTYLTMCCILAESAMKGEQVSHLDLDRVFAAARALDMPTLPIVFIQVARTDDLLDNFDSHNYEAVESCLTVCIAMLLNEFGIEHIERKRSDDYFDFPFIMSAEMTADKDVNIASSFMSL